MEGFKNSEDDIEEEEFESVSPKKKEAGLFSKFLLSLKESRKDSDQNARSEEVVQDKGFRRFFKGLFGGMVENPRANDSETTATDTIHPISLNEPEIDQNNLTNDQEAQNNEEDALEVPEWAVLGDLDQEIVDTNDEPYQGVMEIDHTQDTTSEITPSHGEPQYNLDAINDRPATPDARTEAVGSSNYRQKQNSLVLPVILAGSSIKKHRESKLSKSLDNKIAELDKRTNNTKIKNEQLETITKSNTDALDRLNKEKDNLLDGKPPAKEEISISKKPEQPRPAETVPTKPNDYYIRKETGDSVIAKNENHDTPKNAKPETVSVIETTEKKYEALEPEHLKKGTLVDIGTIASSRLASYGSIRTADTRVAEANLAVQPNNSSITDDIRAGIYARAISMGFWTATAIIIFGFITYLLK